jgi:hypothetical protein
MQVAKTEFQHQIMIEAVENHMPQVIIVDEIGTELEVLAARTIAEKGVQLVGTTHGNCLENLIRNPLLVDLIGGIQYVTLSDEEAKRRGTQKSILERKAYPAFEIIIEINYQNSWTIHEDVKKSVDLFLRDNFTIGQFRQFYLTEKIKIKCQQRQTYSYFLSNNSNNLNNSFLSTNKNWTFSNQLKNQKSFKLQSKKLVIYPYSLSHNLLKEVLLKMGLKFVLTNEIKKANLIIGLKKHLKQNFKLTNLAKQKNIPIYALNQVNMYQVRKLLQLIQKFTLSLS